MPVTNSPMPTNAAPPQPEEPVFLSPKERFALGLLLPLSVLFILAHWIGGIWAPGWAGVGSQLVVEKWMWWGTITTFAAATLGIGAAVSLTFCVVRNPNIPGSVRFATVVGTGLLLFFVSSALRHALETGHLIVMAAGAFALAVAGAVEALGPTRTRALGLQLSVLSLAALFRIASWWLVRTPEGKLSQSTFRWAHWLSTTAFIFEAAALILVILYLFMGRPGWRGTVLTALALLFTLGISIWVLGTTIDHQYSLRDALQKGVSQRLHAGGPPPSWVDLQWATHEIAFIDRKARNALLPGVMLEFGSLFVAMASLGTASRASFPVLAAMAFALLSRGQIDTPLRALELGVAGLAIVLFARAMQAKPLENSEKK